MPEPIILFALLLLLPMTVMGWMLRRKFSSRIEALVTFDFVAMLVLFLFLWGQYPYVGSYYLRYVPLVMLAVVAVAVLGRVRARPWWSKPGVASIALLGMLSMGTMLFAVLSAYSLMGRSPDAAAVSMEFPLGPGSWYVSTGGSNALTNLHRKPHTPAQHHAVDFDRLDGFGRIAERLIPSTNEEVFIFRETVLAPCDGTVVDAVNDTPDHAPYVYESDSGGGNRVVLDCAGITVSLLHLQRGSVSVASGDDVSAGYPIGRVGNSGFSVLPHLHMQASRRPDSGAQERSTGIPVVFDGWYPVRNDVHGID